jgi:predicted ATPase
MNTLQGMTIKGFKSIESAALELGDLNVVIGANGSGKSNLIGAFRLLEKVLTGKLQQHVASDPDRLLHHGRKTTPSLSLDFAFRLNYYGFALKVAQDTLIFELEQIGFKGDRNPNYKESIPGGHKESLLENKSYWRSTKVAGHIIPIVRSFVVYHFHDTSDDSPIKQMADVEDNRTLRRNASNLASYLFWLQESHPTQFRHIEEHVRLVAPFFDCFVLAPSKLNPNKIKLEWRQHGSDAYFDGYSLSDGTLRFICLATLLLQPSPPELILLDEPELGLHPSAIVILSEMLKATAKRTQVLIATQSVTLLNNFVAKDVIVAEHDGAKTTFIRHSDEDLKDWLDDYSLGELWEMNVIGGRP